MSLLFGVDNKNKEIGKIKKDKINVKKNEDIDDVIKIIDIIEKNEDKKINSNFIDDIDVDNENNELDINNKHYYKKMPEITGNISKRNKKKFLAISIIVIIRLMKIFHIAIFLIVTYLIV